MVVMKNSLILGALALSILCPSSWGRPPAPAVTTAQVPELSARILLDTKPSHSKGEEVVLEITLENTGTRSLRFHNRNIASFYDIEVTAGGNEIEPLPDFKGRPSETPFSGDFILSPQDKKKGYFYLNRAFDLSKEGLYTVTISRKVLQPEGIFTITSQPLDFKVAGAPIFGDWGEYSPPAVPQPQPETPPAKQP